MLSFVEDLQEENAPFPKFFLSVKSEFFAFMGFYPKDNVQKT